MKAAMNHNQENLAARAAPVLFVVLWSTGFIGTKYVINNADPLTYLAIRMAVVVGLMAIIAAIARPKWPDRIGIAHSAVAGILIAVTIVLIALIIARARELDASRSPTVSAGSSAPTPHLREPAAADESPAARRPEEVNTMRRKSMALGGRFLLAALAAGLLVAAPFMPSDPRADTPPAIKISIAFLHEALPEPPPLSLVEPVAKDTGLAGARLGMVDNNTTGRFLGQQYELKEVTVPAGGDLDGAVKSLIAGGTSLIVADLSAKRLLEIADLPEAKQAVILNTAAEDDELRTQDCRANVFHIIPSRAMKAVCRAAISATAFCSGGSIPGVSVAVVQGQHSIAYCKRQR